MSLWKKSACRLRDQDQRDQDQTEREIEKLTNNAPPILCEKRMIELPTGRSRLERTT